MTEPAPIAPLPAELIPETPVTRSPAAWKKVLFRGAMLLLAAGLLGWVFSTNRTSLEAVARRGPRWELLPLAVALLVIESFNLTLRWRILLTAVEVPLPFLRVYRMVVGAIVAGLVIPGANGGDALKLALVAGSTPARTRAIASLILDRVVGLCGLLLVGLVAGTAAWATAPPLVRDLTIVCGVLAATIIAGLGLLQARWFRPLWMRVGGWHPRLAGIAAQLAEAIEGLRTRPRALIAATLLAMLGQTINIGVFYLMSRALRIEGGDPLSFFVLVPFVFVSTAVPLPFGALGVTEGVSDQLFRWCGVTGGGVGMLGYRFAYLLSMPILVGIAAAVGTTFLKKPFCRDAQRSAVQDSDDSATLNPRSAARRG